MHHHALLKQSDPSCFGVSFTLVESQCQLAPSFFLQLKKKKDSCFLETLSRHLQLFKVLQSFDIQMILFL